MEIGPYVKKIKRLNSMINVKKNVYNHKLLYNNKKKKLRKFQHNLKSVTVAASFFLCIFLYALSNYFYV